MAISEYLTTNEEGHVIKHVMDGNPPQDSEIDLTALDGGGSAFGIAAQAVSNLAAKMRIPVAIANFYLNNKGILKP